MGVTCVLVNQLPAHASPLLADGVWCAFCWVGHGATPAYLLFYQLSSLQPKKVPRTVMEAAAQTPFIPLRSAKRARRR